MHALTYNIIRNELGSIEVLYDFPSFVFSQFEVGNQLWLKPTRKLVEKSIMITTDIRANSFMLNNTEYNSLPGIAAFDGLRAEDDDWLFSAFESPPEFDLISGPRSAIIFGESGSGKTATLQALHHISVDSENKLQRLLVNWHPTPPKPDVAINSTLVETQFAQVMDACALELITYLANHPDAFHQAPSWAQMVSIWFVRLFLRGDFEIRTGPIEDLSDEAGKALLSKLSQSEVRTVLDPDAAPELVVAELVKIVKSIGLSDVWILIDNLDQWVNIEAERFQLGLTAFLSTLGLFEQRGFVYKIFLPDSTRAILSRVSGVHRRRIDIHHLHWTQEKLLSLVRKRLSLALDMEIGDLGDICSDKKLVNWLERCGGQSPRGWLEAIRPLVSASVERVNENQLEPITKAEWRKIRRRHPPQLILNEERKQVIVGERRITDLSELPYRLLHYLYKNAGQVCSRSELYYRAHRGLNHEPSIDSDDYEIPGNYESAFDTTIWRLRNAIEPDPKDPLFVVTVKGKGLRLENTL